MSESETLSPLPESPFFSIVIPTFRRNDTLVDALVSIENQTFGDYEIIVVDDDPLSGAENAVKPFMHLPLRYVVNKLAKGGSGARNTGIAMANGAWVAFLDDDDVWLPRKLECVRTLIQDSQWDDLVLVYSGNVKYDFNEHVVVSTVKAGVRGEVLPLLLYKNHVGGMSVAVAKTSALREVEGFDVRFEAMQDMELYVRLAQLGRFDCIPQPLVRIRWSKRERITVNPRKKLQGALLFQAKFRHLLFLKSRLRHRAAARVFTFAIAAAEYGIAIRSAPWALAGLLVDTRNAHLMIRGVIRQLRARHARTLSGAQAGTR